MTDQEIRTFEMLKRLGVFRGTHPDSFGAGTLGRELFDAISDVVDEVEGYATSESAADGSKRLNTVSKAVARETLREILEAMRRTARSMAFTIPGLEDKFRIPRNASDQVLLNTARAFAQEALPLKAEFIRHEMPADFVERLNAAVNSLEDAIRGQSASKGARRQAGAAIDGALDRGLDAARRLDPLVRNKFADQPSVLAEWQSARHIQRPPRTQRDGNGGGNTGGNNNTPPPA